MPGNERDFARVCAALRESAYYRRLDETGRRRLHMLLPSLLKGIAGGDGVGRFRRLQRRVDGDVGGQVLVEGVDVLDLDPHLVLDRVVRHGDHVAAMIDLDLDFAVHAGLERAVQVAQRDKHWEQGHALLDEVADHHEHVDR